MDTVYIVEDHAVTRMGLAQLLRRTEGVTVCGEAASAPEALEEIPKLMPDLVVVDLALEGSSGLDLIAQIAARWEAVRMLVISSHDETIYAERALKAGAQGYVMKSAEATELRDAVRTVLRGRRYLSDAVTDLLLGRMVGQEPPEGADRVGTLSDREMEVFELIGRGLKRGEIAEALQLSPKTVDNYRERLKKKLGVPTSTKLAHRAAVWIEQKL